VVLEKSCCHWAALSWCLEEPQPSSGRAVEEHVPWSSPRLGGGHITTALRSCAVVRPHHRGALRSYAVVVPHHSGAVEEPALGGACAWWHEWPWCLVVEEIKLGARAWSGRTLVPCRG
jgi:hypothetical protein